MKTEVNIADYRLEQTCGACPEQYNVFLGNEQVGYLRLRHGYFYASVPDCSDNIVYEAYTKGDGMFLNEERLYHLTKAIEAIDNYRKSEGGDDNED